MNGRATVSAVKTTGNKKRSQHSDEQWPRIYPGDDGYDEETDWPGRQCAVKTGGRRVPARGRKKHRPLRSPESSSDSPAIPPLSPPERRPARPKTNRGLAWRAKLEQETPESETPEILPPERRPDQSRRDQSPSAVKKHEEPPPSLTSELARISHELQEELVVPLREFIERLRKTEFGYTKTQPHKRVFFPGSLQYDTVFAFRAEFLDLEGATDISEVSFEGEDDYHFDRFVEKFRKYMESRVDKELFDTADTDGPEFWMNILLNR